MKVSVCDVCKYKDGKLVESGWKRGYKGWPKLDACEAHKDYDMGNTPQEFNHNLMELAYGHAEVEIVDNPKIVPVKG